MTNWLVVVDGDLTTVQELMGHQHITRALSFSHAASKPSAVGDRDIASSGDKSLTHVHDNRGTANLSAATSD